jgi:hypothetical protein
MTLKPLLLIAVPLLACGSGEAPTPIAEARTQLVGTCNAFQPDHCGSCADTLPFQEALQVTIPWCNVDLCSAWREVWFCNPTISDVPVMCSVVTGPQPEGMNVYCCDPVAANTKCDTNADCGGGSSECYQPQCVDGACVVEPKPVDAPCSVGVCRFFEPGRPMACGPTTI